MRPIDADTLPEIKMHVAEGCYTAKEVSERVNAALIIARNNVRRAPTLSLNTLRDAIYQDAVAHGLWDDMDDVLSEDLLDDCYKLINDEVDELGNAIKDWVNTGSHNHFAEELADVIIMSLSVAGKLGLDIDKAVKRKMEINKGRSFRHEGEKRDANNYQSPR